MKILHVISSVDPKGGGPIEGVKQIDSSLLRSGVEVDVVSCDPPYAAWPVSKELPRHYALGPSYLGYGYSPNLLPWLKKNAARYDAVVVNGIWQYHSFAVRRALRGTRTPYFVFTHGMLDPWFKRAYPFKHLKKWLYWPWAEYRVLRDARAVVFTCEEERLLARQSFWLYHAKEVVTAYGTASSPENGKELAEKFFAAHPRLRGKRIALFLSRIHEKKGCDLLLSAFAEVAKLDNRLHLIIAGPDQAGWLAALKSQAEQLNISDRISWPGMLQGDDKWGVFYASEVFCLPSHQENFGIVVAEALACGKPVLISNKVNIWREIEADKSGFVDEDSTAGTVRNLRRWLQLSPEAYAQMCERARLSFSQRFHIDRAAARLLEIIREHAP